MLRQLHGRSAAYKRKLYPWCGVRWSRSDGANPGTKDLERSKETEVGEDRGGEFSTPENAVAIPDAAESKGNAMTSVWDVTASVFRKLEDDPNIRRVWSEDGKTKPVIPRKRSLRRIDYEVAGAEGVEETMIERLPSATGPMETPELRNSLDQELHDKYLKDLILQSEKEETERLARDAELTVAGMRPPPPDVEIWKPSKVARNVDWRYFLHAGPRMDLKTCGGCGAKLQAEDPMQPGFLEKEEKFSKPLPVAFQETFPVRCDRCQMMKCHRVTHEYEQKFSDQAHKLALNETRKLATIKCVVIYVVDVTDLSGSCVNLTELIGDKNPIIVVLSKCDRLPKGFSMERIMRWATDELRKRGVSRIYSIHIGTGYKKHGPGQLLAYDEADVLAKKGNCDIYVVGAVNSGKSTFINKILSIGWRLVKKDEDRRHNQLTTSTFAGTTQDKVAVAVGDGTTIYDMPGLMPSHHVYAKLTTQEIQLLSMGKKIYFESLQVQPGRSILFGGLGFVRVEEGQPILAWYTNEHVLVRPLMRSKESVINYINESAGSRYLYPPYDFDEDFDQRWNWKEKVVEVQGRSWATPTCDLVLPGIGWVCMGKMEPRHIGLTCSTAQVSVTVKGRTRLRIVVPDHVRIMKRKPMFPDVMFFGIGKWTGWVFQNKHKERMKNWEKKYKTYRVSPTVAFQHFFSMEEIRKDVLKKRRFLPLRYYADDHDTLE